MITLSEFMVSIKSEFSLFSMAFSSKSWNFALWTFIMKVLSSVFTYCFSIWNFWNTKTNKWMNRCKTYQQKLLMTMLEMKDSKQHICDMHFLFFSYVIIWNDIILCIFTANNKVKKLSNVNIVCPLKSSVLQTLLIFSNKSQFFAVGLFINLHYLSQNLLRLFV